MRWGEAKLLCFHWILIMFCFLLPQLDGVFICSSFSISFISTLFSPFVLFLMQFRFCVQYKYYKALTQISRINLCLELLNEKWAKKSDTFDGAWIHSYSLLRAESVIYSTYTMNIEHTWYYMQHQPFDSGGTHSIIHPFYLLHSMFLSTRKTRLNWTWKEIGMQKFRLNTLATLLHKYWNFK